VLVKPTAAAQGLREIRADQRVLFTS
jgi:hypothetical protein